MFQLLPPARFRMLVCVTPLRPFRTREVEAWVLGNAATHTCHAWLGQVCGPAFVSVAPS